MSKGGGGSSNQTVTQNIPSWMQDIVQSNYSRAQGVASTPYQPYTGQGVAPINSTQQAGIDATINAANAGTGASNVNTASQIANSAAGYQPIQVGAPDQSTLNGYMNPYTQNVINTTNQNIQQQNAIANQQESGSATSAGAFGGAREGVQQAMNNKNYGQIMASTDASLNSQNFTNAQQQAQTAQLANQNAGLTANQQHLQSAVDLGSLGQAQQGIALGYANALQQAGATQQQTQNAQDQFNYGQYYNNMMYPYQQLQALTGATFGGNVGGSTTSPIYQNNVSSGIGTGLAGAGLISSLGGSGTTSALGGGALGLLSMFG